MAEQAVTGYKKWLEGVGEQGVFFTSFFRNIFRGGFEWSEFVRQCYEIGYRSMMLVGITSFIMGLVLILQLRPSMLELGAESMLPKTLAVSFIREIGPVIIAIICAGKVASGIGAELGSMKVTEQIDAMEVSGANPLQYLVVTRILATSLMIPLLTIIGDAIGLFGGFLALNFTDDISFSLYFHKCIASLEFIDLFPALVKTVFFGFAIGFVGCYKGYNSNKGTESVGIAANSAVVTASLWIFVIDALAVQITSLLFYR
ncbi:MlaE family ABC transporter permease [Mucilaginibacter phyllosphaerae]|uniref:ABC transporter permease n=1 Tax=Mucilaginibacter phyllosphaerae TaxID=1812349 RepID=A0A4Y8ACZ1_9SPHI|nr:ABC transporter permease [Mucilaginibacter phyllosphaerae]MBB3970138.1 phospholipid/cholesterol/gamma-HCH transport system permease protein [Mucilaginibacter phyllosphaerae]TEW66524.1 ABC transporter permease [Mucilaginibacter phyllosphaerae]GGH10038.1 ABC transporter permease [Mucilaginibacter phyllosphaerae]